MSTHKPIHIKLDTLRNSEGARIPPELAAAFVNGMIDVWPQDRFDLDERVMLELTGTGQWCGRSRKDGSVLFVVPHPSLTHNEANQQKP